MTTRMVFFLVLFANCYSPFAVVYGFDRTNVPIKNWGGFSVNQGWVYDALERVVLAGLADRALLNTKPLSRVAAARIVAQAVGRIRSDLGGDYNHRGYLEETVYQLVEEFGGELTEMGVRTPLNPEVAPGFLNLKPIKNLQLKNTFSNESRKLFNSFGTHVSDGPNSASTAEGSLQVGDYLSVYYQPEFSTDWDSYQGKLINGYGKVTFWNTEVLVGRDTLWWGPGYRGSMSFSNNAFPLDQVRVGSAEPFHLPWFLKHMGLMNFTVFAAQLDKYQAEPHSKVGGWRIDVAPFSFMEFGFSRVFQFDGGSLCCVNLGDFFLLMLGQGSDNPNSKMNVNNVMSMDLTLRFPNAERYIWITRDLSLYGEMGWDDTTDPGFQLGFIPTGSIIPRKPGGIIGFLFSGFLWDPKLDFRLELAKTSNIQFTHSFYSSGFVNRGGVMSHFIGTNGSEFYARLSRWMSPDVLMGLDVSLARIGSTDSSLAGAPREKRDTVGLDLSYRMSNNSTVFMKYNFGRVENRDFVTHKTEKDSLLRFEFTRKFKW